MTIERDSGIRFHEAGTLNAVTSWIGRHDQGISEWLKNSRRAYQSDRANVDEKHRSVLILLKDENGANPARIGVLDVGGATAEDLNRWSVWQDPNASSGKDDLEEEQTQGNGGKAYMYRLFQGVAKIVGVRGNKLNCKGFEGINGTVERGTPGYIPDISYAKDYSVSEWDDELVKQVAPYEISLSDLPETMHQALKERKSFTLVEGINPINIWQGKLNIEDLIPKLLHNEQIILVLEQMRVFVMHNGFLLNDHKPLTLEPINPYTGFETPVEIIVPDSLKDNSGTLQSTTSNGKKQAGKLILFTSKDNMASNYKRLKPRWKIIYRSANQMIGTKPVSEIVPTTPGSQHIYATLILPALEPDYVMTGRFMPAPGPLIDAVDEFIAENIRELAKKINDLQKHEHDQQELDEVHKENRLLDQFKNQFLRDLSSDLSGGGNAGTGEGGPIKPQPPPITWGTKPVKIEFKITGNEIRIGRGVKVNLPIILGPTVRDAFGRPVSGVKLDWIVDNENVLSPMEKDGEFVAKTKGMCKLKAVLSGSYIQSDELNCEVWEVDHVLLSPRQLQIPVGVHKQIMAEVTNDEGKRSTEVLLNWKHTSDSPLLIRIRPTGWVTGNRVGKTSVTAGAGDPSEGGVWARIASEIEVIPNQNPLGHGEGMPQLKLTGKDEDPETGEIREGDPEQPSLWQEPADVKNNVWWLNLESSEANYTFSQREENPKIWRLFHAEKLVEMVAQVYMHFEYSLKGDSELKDYWVSHKARFEDFQVQLGSYMWEKLKNYVETGGGLE